MAEAHTVTARRAWRAILFATMAQGTSHIYRYLKSPDTMAMITACKQLGASIDINDELLTITGVAGHPRLPDDVIDAGNSGQVLRFVAAIAALIDGYTIFTGDHSIRFIRPIGALLDGLSDLSASCISTKGDGHAPMNHQRAYQCGQRHARWSRFTAGICIVDRLRLFNWSQPNSCHQPS